MKPSKDTAVSLLKEIQEKRLHEPNSDWHEYCAWCHRSPYNVPPHDKDCMVPRIAKVLDDQA